MEINFDFACRDDCLAQMVPSDLRTLVAQRDMAREQIAMLESRLSSATQDNADLRLLAFLQHGNAEHYLYGDDGERYCNTCGCDFKNDTPMELRNKISEYSLIKLARSQALPGATKESP